MKKFLIFTTIILTTMVFLNSSNTSKNEIVPDKILSSLEKNGSVSQFGIHTWYASLTMSTMTDVQEAFLSAGYSSLEVPMIEGVHNAPQIFTSGNSFVTLRQRNSFLQVVWNICDPKVKSLLYPNESTGTGSVTLVQIGVERMPNENSNPMNGMCYIYKLSDGSAVIIDGGHMSNADNLYAALQKLDIKKDQYGRFNITAWIFTHGHGDHYSAFFNFAAKYHADTHISYIMHSFPTDENILSPADCDVSAFVKHIRNHYPDAIHVTPHAGLKYHFGNLTLDMLYTPDLMYPTIQYSNDTSLIFIADCNGARVLYMGDAGDAAAQTAWEEYESNAFDADIVQITHHGLTTAQGEDNPNSHEWTNLKNIYTATHATIGLLPMGTRSPTANYNGRWVVLNVWAGMGYQTAFLINDRLTEDNKIFTPQKDYDQFIDNIASGTCSYKTLFGYNGVNIIFSKNGLITYIMSTETENMATVFSLSGQGIEVLENQLLHEWLNQLK